jgi:hypothetical protein
MIRDSTGSIEDQERSALDEFLGGIRDFGGSLIYGPGPEGGVSNNFPYIPIDSGDTPFTGSTPALTPEQALEKWFEDNRGAPAQEIFNVMQANNVSPEYVINQWGLDPTSAMATYDTFMNPATAPAVTPPAVSTDDGTLNDLLGGARNATTAVAGVIDTGLKQLGDLIGMGDPSLVVLNPVNPTASVVYGTPQGNTTPTIIGNMPKSGAPVGVITGIPALDNILSGVFNQRGQGGMSIEEIIRGAVLEEIGKETGYPAAGVAGAIGGGLSGDLNKVIDSVNKVVLQIDKKVEDADSDPIRIINNPDAYRGDPVGPVQITPDSPAIVTGAADSPIVTGADVLDTRTPGTVDVLDGLVPRTLTPVDLGEDTTVKTTQPGTVKAGTPGTPVTPVTPAPSQGMRMEATEKAGLADINSTFDLDATFMENLMRALSGKDDAKSEAPYYSGGKVAPYAGVDEIIRLLRG